MPFAQAWDISRFRRRHADAERGVRTPLGAPAPHAKALSTTWASTSVASALASRERLSAAWCRAERRTRRRGTPAVRLWPAGMSRDTWGDGALVRRPGRSPSRPGIDARGALDHARGLRRSQGAAHGGRGQGRHGRGPRRRPPSNAPRNDATRHGQRPPRRRRHAGAFDGEDGSATQETLEPTLRSRCCRWLEQCYPLHRIGLRTTTGHPVSVNAVVHRNHLL